MYDLPVIGWCLYYSDGSTFTNEQGDWDSAPSDDVQILKVLHEPPYRTFTYGYDTYQLTPESSVKLGRYMNEEAFYALVEKAYA